MLRRSRWHSAPGPWRPKRRRGYMRVAGRSLGLLLAGFVLMAPAHFVREHLVRHVVREHAPRIFFWTFGALALTEWVTRQRVQGLEAFDARWSTAAGCEARSPVGVTCCHDRPCRRRLVRWLRASVGMMQAAALRRFGLRRTAGGIAGRVPAREGHQCCRRARPRGTGRCCLGFLACTTAGRGRHEAGPFVPAMAIRASGRRYFSIVGCHTFQTLPTRSGPGLRVSCPGSHPAGVASVPLWRGRAGRPGSGGPTRRTSGPRAASGPPWPG